jgi:DNA-binding XRE family transcriptional regulator
VTVTWVHGRTGWIRHGCRCSTCHHALVEYARIRRAVRAVVQDREPVTRVPAGKARAKVRELRARGMTQRQIAKRAGVSDATVCRIEHATVTSVSLPTARRIAGL